MKNTCSPQANSVYHQLSPKTHGMEKYLAMQHESWAFFFYWTVYLDFSIAEKSLFSVGLKTNVTPQSLPILISFYRHNKSSGTRINGGVRCCRHPSELHIHVYRSTAVLNSLFMSFSLESIHSLLILYVCDLELCLKWLDISWGSAAEIQEAFSAFLHFVFLPVLCSVHICFTSFNIQIESGDVVWVETFFSLLHFWWIIQVY